MNQYNDKEIKAGLEESEILAVLNNTVQVTWVGSKPTGFSATLKGKTKEVVKDTNAKKGRVRASATVLETRNNALGKMLSVVQQAQMKYKVGTHPSDVRGVRIVSTDRVAEIQAMVDEMSKQLDDLRVEALRDGIPYVPIQSKAWVITSMRSTCHRMARSSYQNSRSLYHGRLHRWQLRRVLSSMV